MVSCRAHLGKLPEKVPEPIVTENKWYKFSEKKPPLNQPCLVYLPVQGTWVARYYEYLDDGPQWHCVSGIGIQEVLRRSDPLWCLLPKPEA